MRPSDQQQPVAGQSGGAPRRHVSPLSVALALATPAVTVPMLALARYWSDHEGGQHSVGDMVPLALGGGICMAVVKYTASDDSELTGMLAAVAGSCLAIGSMTYPAGMAQPIITAAVFTVGGWALSWRAAKANKKTEREFANQQAERDNAYDIANLQAQAAIGVATIQGQASVEVARINGATALGVADRNVLVATSGHNFSQAQVDEAWRARRALDAPPAPEPAAALQAAADPRDAFFGQPASPTSDRVPAEAAAPAEDPRDAFFGQPGSLSGVNR